MYLWLLEMSYSHLRVSNQLATLQHFISQILIILSLLFLVRTRESTLSVHLLPQFTVRLGSHGVCTDGDAFLEFVTASLLV